VGIIEVIDERVLSPSRRCLTYPVILLGVVSDLDRVHVLVGGEGSHGVFTSGTLQVSGRNRDEARIRYPRTTGQLLRVPARPTGHVKRITVRSGRLAVTEFAELEHSRLLEGRDHRFHLGGHSVTVVVGQVGSIGMRGIRHPGMEKFSVSCVCSGGAAASTSNPTAPTITQARTRPRSFVPPSSLGKLPSLHC
jgi:hypothetical protein